MPPTCICMCAMPGCSVESANKLSSSRLIFVTVSEMSDMIPVAVQHPVLLDVATKETITRTVEPMAPLSFRGFRLHTVWNQLPGGDSVHQVTFPHLLGEATASMLEYEQEKFPQSLMQGPKMVINLGPPSSDHWNIVSDLVLPLTVDKYKQQREAKRAEQDSEGEQRGLQRRNLLPGRLLSLWQVAAKLCPQQRPHTRGREPWRPHSAFSNTSTPSVSRPYMMLEA